MTQEEVLRIDMLRHPIAAYFSYAEKEIGAALEQAQYEGSLSRTIDAIDTAASLIAIVQGGYVLSRALQDPQQMEKAVNGALALLDNIEKRG